MKNYKKEMDQSNIMLQALCCLFIAAKNYEKDPNVPSSRKFLRQLPGYKPSQE
jgi:nucleoid-associated protein YejK